jgi:hypothetical protein
MSQKIAKLPENTLEDSPVPSPVSLPALLHFDDPALDLADYSDKSFVVFGEATRTYKDEIKKVGGRFNGKLKERSGFPGGPAWIFPMAKKSQMIEFVNSVNKHPQQKEAPILSEGCDGVSLPTVVAPVSQKVWQYVKWRVYKPSVGMKVTVKVEGVEVIGTVTDVESHKDIVDTVYVKLENGTTKLVICNGKWTVWGYLKDHTVYFSKTNSTPPSSPGDHGDDVVNI